MHDDDAAEYQNTSRAWCRGSAPDFAIAAEASITWNGRRCGKIDFATRPVCGVAKKSRENSEKMARDSEKSGKIHTLRSGANEKGCDNQVLHVCAKGNPERILVPPMVPRGGEEDVVVKMMILMHAKVCQNHINSPPREAHPTGPDNKGSGEGDDVCEQKDNSYQEMSTSGQKKENGRDGICGTRAESEKNRDKREVDRNAEADCDTWKVRDKKGRTRVQAGRIPTNHAYHPPDQSVIKSHSMHSIRLQNMFETREYVEKSSGVKARSKRSKESQSITATCGPPAQIDRSMQISMARSEGTTINKCRPANQNPKARS